MALQPRSCLGPYEIVALLGAGGMGEVYRARDPRLQRDVAVKVLPPAVAADRDRLRRFEQEARAVAALNHPNILAVYDVGEESGLRFIVSELLDGESLRDTLSEGPLAARRAIDIAVQMARGLAAAHENGIIHRDLKPENVFITRDGRVKILDFGLAKPIDVGHAGAAPAATMTPTVAGGTEPGLVLGTVGYMSPEQVRGADVDHRTDIFSFGALLYELVTGRRAFQRDTAAETMTAILKEDPPEMAVAGSPTPLGIDRIVRHALEKSPGNRFQSAKDLVFALESAGGTSTAVAVQPEPRARRFGPIAAVLAALVVVAVGAAGYFAGTRGAAGSPVFERLTFQRGYVRGARFTPDGRSIVYSAMWEGRPYEVFTARIGDHSARSLELHDAMVLGVSAAGDVALLTKVRRIRSNFMQVGTLARVPLGGGAPRELLEDVWDADISRDGTQFAVVRTPAGSHQLEYPIGRVVFKTDGYISHPRISPDGRQVAFQEHPLWGDDRGYLDVVDPEGKVKRLTDEVESEQGIAWSADGREIWYGATGANSPARSVFAVTPSRARRMIVNVPGDVSVCDLADNGRLLFSHETVGAAQFVASQGMPERDMSVLGFGMWGALSDDGQTLAFSEEGPVVGGGYLVFVRRLDGSPAIEIGTGTTLGITPDGKAVVALVPGQPTKIRVLPTGAGETRTFDVAPVQVDAYFISWLPGAKEFIFLGHEVDARPRAYRVALAGGPARPVTREAGRPEFWNRVSPDGRFLIQAPGVGRDLQGRAAIVDLTSGQVRPLALEDGDEPISWEPDNRHVFVAQERDAGATIYRLDLTTSRREIWKEIRPADPAGLLSVGRFYVTPSGNAYAYGATRYLSALYTYSQK